MMIEKTVVLQKYVWILRGNVNILFKNLKTTHWVLAYTGSSVEGYEYMAVEYDIGGDFIYSTELFSFNDKNARREIIKNTSGAKKRVSELLNKPKF